MPRPARTKALRRAVCPAMEQHAPPATTEDGAIVGCHESRHRLRVQRTHDAPTNLTTAQCLYCRCTYRAWRIQGGGGSFSNVMGGAAGRLIVKDTPTRV